MSSTQTPWVRLFQSHPGGQFASEELWEAEKQRMCAEILYTLGLGNVGFPLQFDPFKVNTSSFDDFLYVKMLCNRDVQYQK